MKKIYQVTLAFFLAGSINLAAQQIGTPGYVLQNQARTSSQPVTPLNGNDTLNTIYSNSQCGLNYAHATQRLGQRFFPVGVPQPAPMIISGIPACAVIDQAFLWTELLGPTAMPITATLQNPVGGTTNYPMTHIGSSVDVCWGMIGTHVYRADVTSSIVGNGNGTYTLSGMPTNLSTSGHDVEGATLLIIYKDQSATYTGSLVIDDGCHTVVGGPLNHTMSGINACAASSSGSAFMMVGDMQMTGYILNMNGQSVPQPQWDWWNFISANTNVSNGQTTCNYNLAHGGDCYTLAVAGLYYQTNCMTCTPTPSVLNVNMSTTPDMCNGNGTATVSVTGGTPPYTYAWYTNPPQSGTTVTNLTAGTYYVQVTDANGACGGAAAVITYGGPTISVTTTPSACTPSGSATANVSGGTSPYSYLWNTTPPQTTQTAVNMVSGNYLVTVTDAGGCTTSANAVVGQFSGMAISFTNTPAHYCQSTSASDGTITVNVVSGGTPPYTYQWATTPVQTTQTATNLPSGVYTVTVTDANGCSATGASSISSAPSVSLAFSSSPAPCMGTGSATITPTGGTAPYTYLWNTTPPQTTQTATNLVPGLYSFSVTDASGCTVTGSGVVGSQSSIVLSTNSTPATYCNSNSASDGSITVSVVSGGTPPYTYAWNTTPVQTTATATNLPTGTYQVLVTDASGCSTSIYGSIGSAPGLSLTFTTTPAPCNGTGSATVAVSGGTAPYTYMWNTSPAQLTPTATGLAPGVYAVTVTDASGCAMTSSVLIQNGNPMFLNMSSTPAPCNGTGSASVTVTGGSSPYSYVWNTTPVQTTASASGLQPGVYMVTVTDASGCTASDSVFVGSSGFVFAYAYQVPTPCSVPPMATVIALGGTAPYTYAWNTIPVQTTDTAFGLTPGNYNVVITDANGCQTASTVSIAATPFQLMTSGTQTTYCSWGAYLYATASDTTAVITWQPGNLTGNYVLVNPLVTTTYTVTATASCGTVTDTLSVILMPGNPASEDICAVTVDTATNKYKVIWQRMSMIMSGTFDIYKESPPNSSNYVLLASQPVAQFSTYLDAASNASVAPERYKLTTTDTCGNVSVMSPHHRGIFLTVVAGQVSGWDLSWTNYEGFIPWGYNIYRGSSMSSLVLLNTVSGSTLAYSDPNPPVGTMYYMVEAANVIWCSPSRIIPNVLIEGDKSLSNVFSTASLGVIDNAGGTGTVSVMPNPSSGSFTLSLSDIAGGKATVRIVDAVGRLVCNEELATPNGSISKQLNPGLSSGVYSLQVLTGDMMITHKIVVNR
ncbi:MAG: hypothetical protein FD123_2153 [Bacteroidetes bacterium]|nr:MAG: hypothetical protein FD123_2153 [Bacteroidota bacterium]